MWAFLNAVVYGFNGGHILQPSACASAARANVQAVCDSLSLSNTWPLNAGQITKFKSASYIAGAAACLGHSSIREISEQGWSPWTLSNGSPVRNRMQHVHGRPL